MKAVLISIQPKWCELIASGEKTIEVRKTRPKSETPFKCYIYCTKPKMITKYVFKPEDYPEYMRPKKTVFCKVPDGSSPFCSEVNGNSKVIGEFVCDYIHPFFDDKDTCLSSEDVEKYANGKVVYGWHISNLKIYNKPRELSEFWAYNEAWHKAYDKHDEKNVPFCAWGAVESDDWSGCPEEVWDGKGVPPCYRCWEEWSGWCHRVARPPQSWCYVEELQE